MSSSDLPTIYAIRKSTGMTQAAFAARYMIPKRSVENWEQGFSECPIYVRYLLALVTNYEKKEKD